MVTETISAEPATATAGPHPATTTAARAGTPVLWLVRHGESTWNALGLVQGHADEPELTGRGISQAREVARQLSGCPIGAIHCSDLRRATATAAPVATALGLAVSYDARLRERSLGVLEGTRTAQLPPALTGIAGTRVIDPDARPPDGESLRDMYWRVAGFADELLATSRDAGRDERHDISFPAPGASHDAGIPEIAIVAHGGTLRLLSAYLGGIPVERMTWDPVGNGRIIRLQPSHAVHPAHS
jgi:2,3-bisphosphoglycerate-dependent phosphoglycerate mutase